MRSASVSLLHYIAEGGFSGSTTPAPYSKMGKPVSTSPAPKAASTKRSTPLMDPSVMGAGGAAVPDVAKEGIGELSKGLRGTFGILPGGGSALIGAAAIKTGADMAANLPKRFEKETKAQQEAVYGMTNVDQFYKNLGMAGRIPLRPSDEESLLKKVFGGLGIGVGMKP